MWSFRKSSEKKELTLVQQRHEAGARLAKRNPRPGQEGLEQSGLIPGHVYTVLGYDPKTRSVKLRNPWGETEPVDQNGKARDGKNDGIFSISVEELTKQFSYMAYIRKDYLKLLTPDRNTEDRRR